ncbi:MAG: hypothetical protein ACMZ64_02485 [Oleiphilus sp.]
MTRQIRTFFVSALCIFAFITPLQAEDGGAKRKLEESIPMPEKKVSDLNSLKRAKLTEEQAINQLKYMMVKGFARMEEQLVKEGAFPPFGLTLSPDGEFKAVIPDADERLPNEVVLVKLTESMAAIAKTRAMWSVGIMYIRAIKRDDGSYAQRIIVMTEHIAGWGRHWAYPFKVENGEVKLGQPTETPTAPVYYVE